MRSLPKPIFAFVILLLTITNVQAAQSSSATIAFSVVDSTTGAPLSDVSVNFVGSGTLNQTTDGNGTTTLSLPFGAYNLTVSKVGCSDFGPQPFSVDQDAPTAVMAKLECSQLTTQVEENPTIKTDKSQYASNETIYWNAAGFAPGAYIQACVGQLCGGVVQANNKGSLKGSFVLDQRVATGNQTLTITNITTGSNGTAQITISS